MAMAMVLKTIGSNPLEVRLLYPPQRASKLLCLRQESKTAAMSQSADCDREGWAAS